MAHGEVEGEINTTYRYIISHQIHQTLNKQSLLHILFFKTCIIHVHCKFKNSTYMAEGESVPANEGATYLSRLPSVDFQPVIVLGHLPIEIVSQHHGKGCVRHAEVSLVTLVTSEWQLWAFGLNIYLIAEKTCIYNWLYLTLFIYCIVNCDVRGL